MSLTATAAINHACLLLNVTLPGEAVDANTSSFLFTELNLMLGIWAQQRGTIPAITRETFATVAGKGGPSNPYTIGLTGNLVTSRPPNQQSVTGAGLLQDIGTVNELEMPRAVITDDAWQAIQLKEMQSSMFTCVYYQPTYASDLGTINLWPVPDSTTYRLVLYLAKRIVAFADRTTTYYFPDGYDEAIITNLAVAAPMGRDVPESVQARARNSLAAIKRANLALTDLPQNLFTRTQGGYYNIMTGSPNVGGL